MGVLTADMKRVVEEQRLGFVATVCADGTPNLSPKGTTAVWDDDHLVFANIRSPGTIANLRQNASVEVNVVDPFLRKGYRFKGVASVLESGALYDKAIAFYKERGSMVSAIREVVLVRVQRDTADRFARIRSRPHRRGSSRSMGTLLPIASRREDDVTRGRVAAQTAAARLRGRRGQQSTGGGSQTRLPGSA